MRYLGVWPRRVAAVALLAALVWPRAVAAEGALAIGLPKDVANEGIAIGWVVNSDSADTAHERALRGCLDFYDAPATTRLLCKVVKTFRGECVAIALDPEAGTPGVGWAIAVSERAASTDALAACASTAGADRRQHCKVTVSRCDGQ
jgi:uncharacterized protein DUF4189